uniref:alpha-(1,3)-fucosyltransferase 7-like isoform X2 n=1 Tax=Solea senegalensis TaxID=28829 RepID=UPI001CD8E1FC|nr:alpha-(1,3)-fucosyltransferase 7-like isoform X2 [Solea senegalensis]
MWWRESSWKSKSEMEQVTEGSNIKKTLHSVKKYIVLSFLCLLLLFIYTGYLSGSQALTTISHTIFWNHSRSGSSGSSNISSGNISGSSNSSDSSSSNSSIRNVTILLWYWPFGHVTSLQGDVCWDLYHIPRCRLVDQHSMFSSADVVVFHNRELIQGIQKLPLDLPRPQGQRWAWLSLESPANNGNLQQYANIFNMTMTYRRDADIVLPYGMLEPQETEAQLVEDVTQNKSSLVCWVVSNYQNHHRRSQVYRELLPVVPVKVYGKWTNTNLPSSDLLPAISRCYFYLAFENSVSKDYITEKLWWNAYQGGAVPVVLGASVSDYKAVAPPNSFIHVDDFASVKDLGRYLVELAKDKKRYSEYFTWRQHWKVKRLAEWRERLCKICVHYESLPQHRVYSNLMAWVNANY